MNGVLKAGAEVQSTIANNFRIAYGSYGSFWRNDGSNLYLMLTNKGDAYGAYNALRPLRVSLETGALQSETPLTVGNTVYASKEITAGYSGAFAWVEQYKTKAPFLIHIQQPALANTTRLSSNRRQLRVKLTGIFVWFSGRGNRTFMASAHERQWRIRG